MRIMQASTFWHVCTSAINRRCELLRFVVERFHIILPHIITHQVILQTVNHAVIVLLYLRAIADPVTNPWGYTNDLMQAICSRPCDSSLEHNG